MTRHLPSRPRFSGVRRRLGSLPHGLPTALTFTGAIAVALLAPLVIVGVAAEQIRDRPDLSTAGHRGVAALVDPPAAGVPPFGMAAAWARVADAGPAAPPTAAAGSSAGARTADRSATAGARATARAAATPDAGASATSQPRAGAGSRDAQARRRHRSCDAGGSGGDGGSACESRDGASRDGGHHEAEPTPSPRDGAPTPSPEDDD